MKRLNKNAIKRGQSLTCLNYAECKHFGRSQTNSMSALLISVVTMIGIMIYGSCSADEDYDYGYYSVPELNTRADGMMGMGDEGNSIIYPTNLEMIHDNNTWNLMESTWRQTLSNATSTTTQEFGFYIYYKNFNTIEPGVLVSGPPVDTTQSHDSIRLGKYKNKNEVCGVFHTHPPLTNYGSNWSRITGPSITDINNAILRKIPCMVCDYAAPRIYGGHNKDAPYQIYSYGVSRRTLRNIPDVM